MADYGDAEAAVIDIIRAADDLGDVPVSPDLVGLAAPWVRVQRTGGKPLLWMRLDNPQIAVDVYGADKATAHDLAWAARAAVFAAKGAYTGHGLTLFDVADADGVAWSPDDHRPDLA